jgi:hypothetical protein
MELPVGVPGTGLSYTETQRTSSSSGLGSIILLIIALAALVIFLAA